MIFDNWVSIVCEDDPNFSDMIKRVLEKEGLEIVQASSGEEGLERFNQGGIDFVLTDYKMDGMSGIDMLREVRQVNPHVPVMLMSGQAGINDLVKEMLEFDACYYIGKPVSVNVLRLGVRQAIKFYFTQRALEEVCADNFRTFIGCQKLAFGSLSSEEKREVETQVQDSMNHFVQLIEKLKKVLSWV